jgi:hypothetical protein
VESELARGGVLGEERRGEDGGRLGIRAEGTADVPAGAEKAESDVGGELSRM